MKGSTPRFLPFTISRSLLKLMSIGSVMPSNHLILCQILRFLLSVFPSIRVFSNQIALHIRWPKYWSFSFSISQPDQWIFRVDFLKDCLVWSPCSPRNFQDSSPAPQFESMNSLMLKLLYGPILTSIYDYWKNHSFDYIDYCQQSYVSAF